MSSPYHSNWEDFIQCEYMDMSSSFSAGAMYSTVDVLYKWDQALYSEKLVSKTTMDLALQSNVFNYGFPDDHTTVIMLTNYDFVPVFKLTESLTGIRFGEQISVPPRPQSYTLDERIYSNYMGTYEGYGCKATVARNEDQLFFVWNDEAVIPFYPISETTLHHTWHDV
ncbi:hypothetical protein [Paenibacillus profundus]|nr:hypothetical protein [Paenibacillus profundus]